MTPASEERSTESLIRALAPHVLGALVRQTRDLGSAEDAVQEALVAAFTQWPQQGVPDNPRGWLIRVAHRRMVDRWRSEQARRSREHAALETMPDAVPPPPESGQWPAAGDDTLLLLFMCCHPALTPASAVALTLRAVAGLTTPEIARPFLVPVATIAQRISRAKERIRTSGVGFEMPDEHDRAARLQSVLRVLYLVFNEGYTASAGPQLQRDDLATEAIRLTREVCALVPGDGDVEGLLALMLLTHARRRARTGPHGGLIPLDEQDRTTWDREAMAEGLSLASTALSRGSLGEYQLLAAIAAVHDEAARAEDTDWPQIRTLYEMLHAIAPSPMVVLNHAVATAMVDGPQAGLTALDSLERDPHLRGHFRLAAVRAHLLERAGAIEAAIAHYRQAAEATTSIPEQHYLLDRAARLVPAND